HHVAVAAQEEPERLRRLVDGEVALDLLEDFDSIVRVRGRAEPEQRRGRREVDAFEIQVAVGRRKPVVMAAGDGAEEDAPWRRPRGCEEAASDFEVRFERHRKSTSSTRDAQSASSADSSGASGSGERAMAAWLCRSSDSASSMSAS